MESHLATSADLNGRQIWENVVVRIYLHKPEFEDGDTERIIDALESRPSWLEFSVAHFRVDGVAEELIAMSTLVARDRSVDEVRVATCHALHDAGIDASVRVEREWSVCPSENDVV